MEKADILHLGRLARIKIHDEEVADLQRDISAVLDYVSVVGKIAGTVSKTVGPVHNVFRDDAVTNTPDTYTERLLDAAPKTDRGMLVVKKILSTD